MFIQYRTHFGLPPKTWRICQRKLGNVPLSLLFDINSWARAAICKSEQDDDEMESNWISPSRQNNSHLQMWVNENSVTLMAANRSERVSRNVRHIAHTHTHAVHVCEFPFLGLSGAVQSAFSASNCHQLTGNLVPTAYTGRLPGRARHALGHYLYARFTEPGFRVANDKYRCLSPGPLLVLGQLSLCIHLWTIQKAVYKRRNNPSKNIRNWEYTTDTIVVLVGFRTLDIDIDFHWGRYHQYAEGLQGYCRHRFDRGVAEGCFTLVIPHASLRSYKERARGGVNAWIRQFRCNCAGNSIYWKRVGVEQLTTLSTPVNYRRRTYVLCYVLVLVSRGGRTASTSRGGVNAWIRQFRCNCAGNSIYWKRVGVEQLTTLSTPVNYRRRTYVLCYVLVLVSRGGRTASTSRGGVNAWIRQFRCNCAGNSIYWKRVGVEQLTTLSTPVNYRRRTYVLCYVLVLVSRGAVSTSRGGMNAWIRQFRCNCAGNSIYWKRVGVEQLTTLSTPVNYRRRTLLCSCACEQGRGTASTSRGGMNVWIRQFRCNCAGNSIYWKRVGVEQLTTLSTPVNYRRRGTASTSRGGVNAWIRQFRCNCAGNSIYWKRVGVEQLTTLSTPVNYRRRTYVLCYVLVLVSRGGRTASTSRGGMNAWIRQFRCNCAGNSIYWKRVGVEQLTTLSTPVNYRRRTLLCSCACEQGRGTASTSRGGMNVWIRQFRCNCAGNSIYWKRVGVEQLTTLSTPVNYRRRTLLCSCACEQGRGTASTSRGGVNAWIRQFRCNCAGNSIYWKRVGVEQLTTLSTPVNYRRRTLLCSCACEQGRGTASTSRGGMNVWIRQFRCNCAGNSIYWKRVGVEQLTTLSTPVNYRRRTLLCSCACEQGRGTASTSRGGVNAWIRQFRCNCAGNSIYWKRVGVEQLTTLSTPVNYRRRTYVLCYVLVLVSRGGRTASTSRGGVNAWIRQFRCNCAGNSIYWKRVGVEQLTTLSTPVNRRRTRALLCSCACEQGEDCIHFSWRHERMDQTVPGRGTASTSRGGMNVWIRQFRCNCAGNSIYWKRVGVEQLTTLSTPVNYRRRTLLCSCACEQGRGTASTSRGGVNAWIRQFRCNCAGNSIYWKRVGVEQLTTLSTPVNYRRRTYVLCYVLVLVSRGGRTASTSRGGVNAWIRQFRCNCAGNSIYWKRVGVEQLTTLSTPVNYRRRTLLCSCACEQGRGTASTSRGGMNAWIRQFRCNCAGNSIYWKRVGVEQLTTLSTPVNYRRCTYVLCYVLVLVSRGGDCIYFSWRHERMDQTVPV
ncbi:hypothetical protein J6590_081503 [Homalodisca vitripennis]|nr:hypothetical protein J6590_081503 [Homalodisca vitripennis]